MQLMKELSLAPGVSGSEEEIPKIIERELNDVADTIERDSMGNIIATKKGSKKAPTVMLASHMDEIGLMVRYIDDLNVLVEIILANKDLEFSLKALNKIDNEEVIIKIYEQNIHEDINVRCISKIRSQKQLTDILQSDKSWRVREACVKKIVSIKVLKDVSLNDENEYVRNVAKNSIKALK